jgi:uncharacterized BrkB/YihY/UPF0761 family membrane protein
VFKRYGEDHGGWLGSLISYYGFFSLYPLLVVFATVATWVFKDRPETLQRVLEALWSKLPFATGALSAEVEEQVRSLDGQGPVLVLSLIVTLWGGVGVVRVLQDTVNSMWGVPRFRRPGFLSKLGRGLVIIGMLGLGVIGTAVVAGITVALDLPIVAAIAAAVANVALSAGIAIALYRIVIGTSVRTAEIVPGALITAVGSYVVTLVGGLYVKYVITRLTGVFGPFATTIGLLAYVSPVALAPSHDVGARPRRPSGDRADDATGGPEVDRSHPRITHRRMTQRVRRGCQAPSSRRSRPIWMMRPSTESSILEWAAPQRRDL